MEFGNPRYQELMDRFVKAEQVGDQALRRVWQDTTQISGVWDRPIYEDFFRAVRAVNATLPESVSSECCWAICQSIGMPYGARRRNRVRSDCSVNRCATMPRQER